MRDSLIDSWLSNTEWASWTRKALPVDASRRSYLRLTDTNTSKSAILMDAPPDTGEDTRPFVRIARHLTEAGFAAPGLFASDPDLGLLLLEDLGEDSFADVLQSSPRTEATLYRSATGVLARLTQTEVLSGLLRLEPEVGANMLDPFFDHFAKVDASTRDEIRAIISALLSEVARPAQVLSLRDFHAENLIWRPSQVGLAQVGLLDFQDAFISPPSYDLASLLFDARRDVSTETKALCISDFALATGAETRLIKSEVAVLSLQRNLRILGIFARLIHQDGKIRYRAFLPRVINHIRTALEHPALGSANVLISDAIAKAAYP